MNKWIPSRKYLAGGIAGVIAFFITTATGMDGEVAMQIATGIFALASYLVPPSTAEIIARYDDKIRKLGE